MSNYSGQTRKKLYKQIIERDGEVCRFCRKGTASCTLVLVNVNCNTNDNRIENLEVLCKSCNYYRNKIRSSDKCVNRQYTETCLEINQQKEPLFRQYVYERLRESRRIDIKTLIDDGAEEFRLSPITIQRYLDKLCSSVGLCKYVLGMVTFDSSHPFFKGEINQYDGLTRIQSQ